MIPDQHPNSYKALDIYTGYFDSLDIMILFFLSQQYHDNERLLYIAKTQLQKVIQSISFPLTNAM